MMIRSRVHKLLCPTALLWPLLYLLPPLCHAETTTIDFSDAIVVVRPLSSGSAETIAATVLIEEVEKRAGVRWSIRRDWPTDVRAVIALSDRRVPESWPQQIVGKDATLPPSDKAEGYSLRIVPPTGDTPARAIVIGSDGRGVFYGMGKLLRLLRCEDGRVRLDGPIDIVTAPQYAMRGHQLGYRALANSYDAWTPQQYEQYIRELAIFGANCIENIPFQDRKPSPLMPIPRPEMNRKLSEICATYDLDYWVWTPANFPLDDQTRRSEAIARHETLYRSCPRLDAVFFPGGDPGHNPPDLVIPFLEDLALRLAEHHPDARIWASLQGFNAARAEAFLDSVKSERPAWLGGIVCGPGSPPMSETRKRLPETYKIRWYPDITHTVRCQYPVSWWDPAFAITLGREPPNPRPADYTVIFRRYAPYTEGFLTYSDGLHDDVNKYVWNMLGWDSHSDEREMLADYARFFFGADVADDAADALLGLENNWQGSLAQNASVDGVLTMWQHLEKQAPRLLDNWRFQLHLLRAYHDAYTRHRLLYETKLEQQALAILDRAETLTAETAMDQSLCILRRADEEPVHPEWRARIDALAVSLFDGVGYQTSVPRFHASGPERGCIMDFVDHPLNNRWWIEDQFQRIRKLAGEADKLAALRTIRTWETPCPNSTYDDVGHVGRSPHVVRGEAINTDPEASLDETPEHAWWDKGMTRCRLSWQHYIVNPIGLDYEGLDPQAAYTLRITGQGEVKPLADGVALTPSQYSTEIGTFKEFAVPADVTRDGHLRITFEPLEESHLNWRKRSHVAEAWLLPR